MTVSITCCEVDASVWNMWVDCRKGGYRYKHHRELEGETPLWVDTSSTKKVTPSATTETYY